MINTVEAAFVGVAVSIGGSIGVVGPPQLVVTIGIRPQLKQISSVQIPVGVVTSPLLMGADVVV